MALINWNFISNIFKTLNTAGENTDISHQQTPAIDISSQLSQYDYTQENDFMNNLIQERSISSTYTDNNTFASAKAAKTEYDKASTNVTTAENNVRTAQAEYNALIQDNPQKEILGKLTNAETNLNKLQNQCATCESNLNEAKSLETSLQGNLSQIEQKINSLNSIDASSSLASNHVNTIKATLQVQKNEILTQIKAAQLKQTKADFELKQAKAEIVKAEKNVSDLKSKANIDNSSQIEASRQKLLLAKQELEKALQADAKEKLVKAETIQISEIGISTSKQQIQNASNLDTNSSIFNFND